MRKSTKAFIEDLLRDYPKIPSYIKHRKEEIMYPYQPQDENVGGGQAHGLNNSPVERIVIKIDDSEFINAFKRQAQAINKALDNCDAAFLHIIEDYYFNDNCNRTLTGLGVEYGFSKTDLYREREKFFWDVLKNLGLKYIAERDQMLNKK